MFPVNQAPWRIFMKFCMWATMCFSEECEACQRAIQNLEICNIGTMFETVQAQISNLKHGAHEIYGFDEYIGFESRCREIIHCWIKIFQRNFHLPCMYSVIRFCVSLKSVKNIPRQRAFWKKSTSEISSRVQNINDVTTSQECQWNSFEMLVWEGRRLRFSDGIMTMMDEERNEPGQFQDRIIVHVHVQRHWVVAKGQPRNVSQECSTNCSICKRFRTRTSVIPGTWEWKTNGMDASLLRSLHTDKGPNGGNYDARRRRLKCREVCLNGEKAETLHDNAGDESVGIFYLYYSVCQSPQLLQSAVTEWYIKKCKEIPFSKHRSPHVTRHQTSDLWSHAMRDQSHSIKQDSLIEFKSRSLVSRDYRFLEICRSGTVLCGSTSSCTWRRRSYHHWA